MLSLIPLAGHALSEVVKGTENIYQDTKWTSNAIKVTKFFCDLVQVSRMADKCFDYVMQRHGGEMLAKGKTIPKSLAK